MKMKGKAQKFGASDRYLDLMKQGFMKPIKRGRAVSVAQPTIACDACMNWHQKGKHTASAEVRRARGFRGFGRGESGGGGVSSSHTDRMRDQVQKSVDLATDGNCSLALGAFAQAEYWRGRAASDRTADLPPSSTRPALDAVRSCFGGSFKFKRR